MSLDTECLVPAVIRGEVVQSGLVTFEARGKNGSFAAPEPTRLLEHLPLRDPTLLGDVAALGVDEIVDYLVALGDRLLIEHNPHLQAARELSYDAAPTTQPVVDAQYRMLPGLFRREALEEMLTVGIDRAYLDGWVPTKLGDGRTLAVRAFGSRAVHISAGNGTLGSALGLIRNALTRGDAILKSPSNDPLTGAAIAQTMCELDPDHPVTRHVSVAYWRGGDDAVERALYHPQNIEKIVAWGGYASIKHITKYLQPGLELVTFDPKRSASIIDLAGLDDASLGDVAARLATDIGQLNQAACTNARVVYVLNAGEDLLDALAERTLAAMLELPSEISTAPKGGIAPELLANLDAARLVDDFYHVVGGEHGEGAVIVSRMPAPIDFAELLADRVANLVPVDSLDDALSFFDTYTQTVGVYPERLKAEVRDLAALRGAQRIATLGHACVPSFAGPQDAIEPLRRLCRWVVDESTDEVTHQPSYVLG
ncbi:MAG: acyl-CoA reductase [Solirubrobacteraceae bacterium]